MNVLIIFETIEGQTAKIVDFSEKLLVNAGHVVRLIDTADRQVSVSYDDIQKVILAAPVHERRHPKSFELLVAADRTALNSRDTLMLSVSLKAAFADGMEEAADFLAEMEMRTGFTATQKSLVAGAVRQGSYDYFSSQILQHVVLAGQNLRVGDGDHEFTNWGALASDLTTFMEA